jgi:hypothetical protein
MLVAFVAACRKETSSTPPPTRDEAAAALKEVYFEETWGPVLRALAEAGAEEDEKDPSPTGSRPSPAPATTRTSPRKIGEPLRVPDVTINEMSCDRVDGKTFDCNITWRYRVEPKKKGRYRFVHASDKWTARAAPP